MVTKAKGQKLMVAACRAAMPPELEALWETILHAPSLAREPILEVFATSRPDERSRAVALLSWCGHDAGGCPVCRMLAGGLLFSLREPVRSAAAAVDEGPRVLAGASFFLGTLLRPMHARAAGLSAMRLEELLAEAAALPAALKDRLRLSWIARGGDVARFSLR